MAVTSLLLAVLVPVRTAATKSQDEASDLSCSSLTRPLVMFVLNPGGSGAEGSKGGDGGHPKLWFFGKLGLYFAALRATFVFFSSRDEKNRALKA